MSDPLAISINDATGRPLADCEIAALYLSVAWEITSMIKTGFSASRNEPTAKDQRRQLERLTREHPRRQAMAILSGQAAFHLERALIRRGEWSDDWRQRPPHKLRQAAAEAMGHLRRQGTGSGRPPDHAMTRFIATAIHIAEEVLNIRPSDAPGAIFRRLLSVCADAFDIHLEELRPESRNGAKRVRAAIHAYKARNLPFGLAIAIGRLKTD